MAESNKAGKRMKDKEVNGGNTEDLLRKVFELYRRKHGLLAEMLRFTTQMTNLSEAEEIEKILALLQVRQGYIDSINIIDSEISEHSREYKKMPDIIEEQRLLCLKLVEEMQELDWQQQQRLAQHFGTMKKLQEKIRMGRQTINAYHKRPSETASVFIDQKE